MSTDNRTRNQVSGATVTWGVILLLIAGVSFAIVMFDLTTITPAVIGWSIVGLGGLLVVAAIVGVVARAVRPEVGSTTEASSPAAATGGDK